MRWQPAAVFLGVLCLGVAGCHVIPIIAAIGSGAGSAVAIDHNVDLSLDVAKPINSLLVCPFAEKDAKDAKGLAAIKAFCANLPNTVEDIPAQAIAVVQALESTP